MAVYGYDFYGRSKYGGRAQIDFGVEPFEARPVSFSTVELTWNQPSGNWNQFRIIRSRSGFAVNEDDGLIVYSTTGTGATTDRIFVDENITGGWNYYAIWLYSVDDSEWQRAGITDVLVPYDYESADKLWELIPEHYRVIHDTAAGYSQTLYNINPQIYLGADGFVENDSLRAFIRIFGWGMDVVRSQIGGILDGYDTGRVHLNRLGLLADQFGATLEPSAPAINNRNLVKNLALLYRKRGTLSGIRELLSLATGWDVDVTMGPNILLNQDQSTFANPEIPYWNKNTRYVLGDWVQHGQYFFQAKTTAYGNAQSPPVTRTDNTWWESTPFLESLPTTKYNRPDTTDVGDWQLAEFNGNARAGSTSIALGVFDPLDASVLNTRALAFRNNLGSTQDMIIRSIPRYASDPNVYNRKLNLMSAIPLPRVVKKWVAGTYYPGERVTYKGSAYEAVSVTQGDPHTATTAWRQLGPDTRPRMNLSFYAHGPMTGTGGTGGLTVYPYFVYFDQNGNFLNDVVCTPTISNGMAFSAFTGPAGFINAGDPLPVGSGKTWIAGSTGSVLRATDDNGGYAYFTSAGIAYRRTTGLADTSLAVTYKSVGSREMGLIFRWSTASNYWTATQTGLKKTVAGVVTSVATWTAFKPGERLWVSMGGSSITVYKDQSVIASVSDAFNQTANIHGIVMEA